MAGSPLPDQVADAIAAKIRGGGLAPGVKLPTEAALVARFSVSRTVVREAISRLKSLGLVGSRQGSGVYVLEPGIHALSFDASATLSRQTVVQIVEVRRALEAEVAALAAQRRTAQDLLRLRACLADIDAAVARGGDGVTEDVRYHRAVAEVARNPFLIATLEYLGQFLQGATHVMRANEARRTDFARQVRDEHAAIVAAIEARDEAAARLAAGQHMNNAIARIGRAGSAFWVQAGVRRPTAPRNLANTT